MKVFDLHPSVKLPCWWCAAQIMTGFPSVRLLRFSRNDGGAEWGGPTVVPSPR